MDITIRKLQIVSPVPTLFFGVAAELKFVFESPVAAGNYTLKGDTEFASRAPVIEAAATLAEASDRVAFNVSCSTAAYLERILVANTKLRIQVVGPGGVVVYHELNACPSINPTDIPTEDAPHYYNAEESDARFATLQSVADLAGSIDNIVTSLASVKATGESTQTKVDALTTNLASVKATGEATQTKVDALTTNLASVKGTVEAFATTLSNISAQVTAWLASPVQ